MRRLQAKLSVTCSQWASCNTRTLAKEIAKTWGATYKEVSYPHVPIPVVLTLHTALGESLDRVSVSRALPEGEFINIRAMDIEYYAQVLLEDLLATFSQGMTDAVRNKLGIDP